MQISFVVAASVEAEAEIGGSHAGPRLGERQLIFTLPPPVAESWRTVHDPEETTAELI